MNRIPQWKLWVFALTYNAVILGFGFWLGYMQGKGKS
jgi:hypothetical protein